MRADSQQMGLPWPADFVALNMQNLIEDHTCTSVALVITSASIVEMLDQIRSRILSFVLEIEGENPKAGEAGLGDEPPVSRQKVDQIYNTTIIGGPNVVAAGSHNVIEGVTQVTGDWSSLKEALKRLGVQESDIGVLQSAIEKDGEESPPGPAVNSWLEDIKDRVGSGSLKLAGNATGSMIATLVLTHLGVI